MAAESFDAQGHWSTYDQPEGVLYRDFSPVLPTILRMDPSFLSMVQIGAPAKSIRYEWGTDDPSVEYVTTTNDAGGTLLNSETAVTFAAASKAYVCPGMLLRSVAKHNVLRDDGPDGYELLLIKTYDADTGSASVVVRDYGHDTTGYTLPSYDAAEQFKIIGVLRPDKSGAGKNMWTGSDSEANYCQTFRYDLSVSGAHLEQAWYGTASQTMSEQVKRRTVDLKDHLGLAELYGIAHRTKPLGAADDGSGDPAYRSMDGVFTMIAKNGSTMVDDTSTTFNEDLVNSKVKALQVAGALKRNRVVCLVSYNKAEVPSTWDRDKVRIDPASTQRGGYVTSYVTKLGVIVDFIRDKQVFDSDVAFLDPDYLPTLHALGSRAWFSFEYRSDEDGRNAAILGDWTIEMRHTADAHIVCTNLD